MINNILILDFSFKGALKYQIPLDRHFYRHINMVRHKPKGSIYLASRSGTSPNRRGAYRRQLQCFSSNPNSVFLYSRSLPSAYDRRSLHLCRGAIIRRSIWG